jgi:hypothetical protein
LRQVEGSVGGGGAGAGAGMRLDLDSWPRGIWKVGKTPIRPSFW